MDKCKIDGQDCKVYLLYILRIGGVDECAMSYQLRDGMKRESSPFLEASHSMQAHAARAKEHSTTRHLVLDPEDRRQDEG